MREELESKNQKLKELETQAEETRQAFEKENQERHREQQLLERDFRDKIASLHGTVNDCQRRVLYKSLFLSS